MLHEQRVQALWPAVGQGLHASKAATFKERNFAASYNLTFCRGCYRRGNGEADQLACKIQQAAGFAVLDRELCLDTQQPRNLIVTFKSEQQWQLVVGSGAAAALGRVETLVLYRTNAFIPNGKWQSLRRLIVRCGASYNLTALPLQSIRHLELWCPLHRMHDVGANVIDLISFTSGCSGEMLSVLLHQSTKSLQHLYVFAKHWATSRWTLADFPNLRSLAMSFLTDMETLDWDKLKRLRRLRLYRSKVSSSYYALLPPNITRLSLEYADVSDNGLAVILTRCVHLQVLDIHDCTKLTQVGYAHLKQCKALCSLHIGHENFTDDDLHFFATSPCLSHRVVSLDLRSNDWRCTDDAFVAFLAACPNICSLDIRFSERSFACLTAEVLSSCQHLESVHCNFDVELPVPGLATQLAPVYDILL